MSAGRQPAGEEPRRLGQLAERFCREIREGQSPSIEEYAAETLELADEIREVFPALELLERAGEPFAEVIGGTLSERIAKLYGRESEHEDELSSEMVRRLAERSGTYGRYQLKGEIARGGQGAVMRVWDDDLRRNLAMKVVLGRTDGTERSGRRHASRRFGRTLGRFLEEAQVTGQLDHPGWCPCTSSVSTTDGRVYFTMKLVKGRDLKSDLRPGPRRAGGLDADARPERDAQGLRGDGLRALEGRDPPRPQARQRHGRASTARST